jgi:hypothetical protein
MDIDKPQPLIAECNAAQRRRACLYLFAPVMLRETIL